MTPGDETRIAAEFFDHQMRELALRRCQRDLAKYIPARWEFDASLRVSVDPLKRRAVLRKPGCEFERYVDSGGMTRCLERVTEPERIIEVSCWDGDSLKRVGDWLKMACEALGVAPPRVRSDDEVLELLKDEWQ